MSYQLELEKAIEKIQQEQAKLVCIQLPDGLKPKAKEVVDKLEEASNAKVVIWLGSNFGACDIPLGLSRLNIDLLISWGHNLFRKEVGW